MADFRYICGMLGNPRFYGGRFQAYSSEQLDALKTANINTVFVNLAWSRPHIDVVGLEHMLISKRYPLLSYPPDEAHRRLGSFKQRVHAVKAAGLKAFGLFGLPMYADYSRLPETYEELRGSSHGRIDPTKSLLCIGSLAVLDFYKELIAALITEVPELDGIEVYTFDQLAEVCDEDSDCPRCHGIPLEDRLPEFLNELNGWIHELKPDFELWWEPWEISAAQTYRMAERIHPSISLALHSHISEVYFINETDSWFRTLTRIAHLRGIQVIAEFYGSGAGEELGPIIGYPCPRLVYNQMTALRRLPGVVGCKEYFGLVPEYFTINEHVTAHYSVTDAVGIEAFLQQKASEYTSVDLIPRLLAFWEFASMAIEIYPWELSWIMQYLPEHLRQHSWGKRLGSLLQTPWDTPSWLSNRRSYYLVVDNDSNLTARTQQDTLTRMEICIEYLDNALESILSDEIVYGLRADFELQREAVQLFRNQAEFCKLYFELNQWVGQLRNSSDETWRMALIRNHDSQIQNLTELQSLVERSRVPYDISLEGVLSTIARIELSKAVIEQDTSKWVLDYFV